MKNDKILVQDFLKATVFFRGNLIRRGYSLAEFQDELLNFDYQSVRHKAIFGVDAPKKTKEASISLVRCLSSYVFCAFISMPRV